MTSLQTEHDEVRLKYELWYHFLKLNPVYAEACETKGGKLSRLYEDFGDIFSIPFGQWYDERYETLFKPNPEARFLFDRVDSVEAFAAYSSDPKGSVVIAVNIHAPLSSLIEQFPSFIRKSATFPPGRRGDDWNTFSGAKYPLRQGPSGRVLQQIYDVYVACEEIRRSGTALDLWKIGQRILAPTEHDRKVFLDSEQRHNYSVRVSQYLEQARELIKNAARNVFPVDTVVEDPTAYPSLQWVEDIVAEARGRT